MPQQFPISKLGYRYCPKCQTNLEEKPVDGFPRLICTNPECDYGFWNNPTPVVAAIVEHESKVVFARNAAWPEGFFATIAGYLEAGESPDAGIAREVKEELNLDSQSISLIGLYPFARKNQLIIAYHVVATGTIELSEELAEWRYYTLDDIEPWPEGTGVAVKEWLQAQKEKSDSQGSPEKRSASGNN